MEPLSISRILLNEPTVLEITNYVHSNIKINAMKVARNNNIFAFTGRDEHKVANSQNTGQAQCHKEYVVGLCFLDHDCCPVLCLC